MPSASPGTASYGAGPLRNIGHRLFYEVYDTEMVVIVVTVGRRDRNVVYKAAENRNDTVATVTTMTEGQQASGNTGTSEQQRLTGTARPARYHLRAG